MEKEEQIRLKQNTYLHPIQSLQIKTPPKIKFLNSVINNVCKYIENSSQDFISQSSPRGRIWLHFSEVELINTEKLPSKRNGRANMNLPIQSHLKIP